ncbi:metallophosphoesterase [Defluviimonas sp. WL0024]|uniref:Metallophosphoesterase n=1 Tax=Albidovulum salinarum TaxID=2984153 RepID=A0ABT2X4Z9_9RHOB|nr:metallophosphoesterase [Defluviimonas sp. WL0024]MCU9849016.1 metallophosphoesterase [Defluviimonas sp. WL0024]
MILADLHHDFWRQAGRDPLERADFSGLDLLIIAGDLANKSRARWKPALEAIGRHIPLDRVHIFPGNHDYYDGRLDRDDKLAAIAKEVGAHFAQKQEIVRENVRFLCCTLWTDMLLGDCDADRNAREAEARMNDYRYIRIEAETFRRAKPRHTVAIHLDHRAWLESRLKAPFDGRTIVVTHHAPHGLSLAGNAPVGQAYASDLSGLIKQHAPDLWLFGHTHHGISFRCGTTQLPNVSVGYPDAHDHAPTLDSSWPGFVG